MALLSCERVKSSSAVTAVLRLFLGASEGATGEGGGTQWTGQTRSTAGDAKDQLLKGFGDDAVDLGRGSLTAFYRENVFGGDLGIDSDTGTSEQFGAIPVGLPGRGFDARGMEQPSENSVQQLLDNTSSSASTLERRRRSSNHPRGNSHHRR